jgi:hypothetical protein
MMILYTSTSKKVKMKNTYQLLTALAMFFSVVSCTKYDNNINLEATAVKQAELTDRIKHLLGDAPNGWLLYVPNLDTSVKSATPVVLQFDTTKGSFTSKSPFPASASSVPSIYELSSATGAPLLSFASGSIFSSWYESGGITDYYFKVLDASTDTITMQPYRKGNIYASEGGIIMKMARLKTPYTVFDNLVDIASVLTANDAPFWNNATNPLQLTYKDGYVQPPLNMEFDKQSAGNLAFFKANVPFCKYLKTTPIFLFANHDNDNPIVYYCGNNALITHVDNGFSPVLWFIDGPKKITQSLKTDYLLVRSVNPERTKIELFAVDRNGNEIITGTLEVK